MPPAFLPWCASQAGRGGRHAGRGCAASAAVGGWGRGGGDGRGTNTINNFCLPGTKDIEQLGKKMSKDLNAQIKQNVDHIAVQRTRLWENEKEIQQLTKPLNATI